MILTGRNSNEVGLLLDMQVGEFLDLVFYDTQNFWADSSFHFSNFAGTSTAGRNDDVATRPSRPRAMAMHASCIHGARHSMRGLKS